MSFWLLLLGRAFLRSIGNATCNWTNGGSSIVNSGNALLFVITADYPEVCGDLITLYCAGRYCVAK